MIREGGGREGRREAWRKRGRVGGWAGTNGRESMFPMKLTHHATSPSHLRPAPLPNVPACAARLVRRLPALPRRHRRYELQQPSLRVVVCHMGERVAGEGVEKVERGAVARKHAQQLAFAQPRRVVRCGGAVEGLCVRVGPTLEHRFRHLRGRGEERA